MSIEICWLQKYPPGYSTFQDWGKISMTREIDTPTKILSDQVDEPIEKERENGI